MRNWLEEVDKIYHNRYDRAAELKQKGKKIIGYLCSFVPLEIFTALDIIPIRLTGNPHVPVSEVHDYLEPNACPYVLNCFQGAIKGSFDFLDGFVIPHSCDTVQRFYGLLKFWKPGLFMHFVSTPTVVDYHSSQFFKEEINILTEKLEDLAGSKMEPAKLDAAIRLYNENRSLIRELYVLRKKNPGILSASNMIKILIAGISIPADEFNYLLKQIKNDLNEFTSIKEANGLRLLLYGCIIDHPLITDVVEKAGGIIVVDDTCIGTRSYWRHVPENEKQFDSLTQAYFTDFICPKLIRKSDASRFQYLADLAKEFNVQGIIAYLLNYCDLHKFDVPDIKDYMSSAGYPVLIIEDDYTMSASATTQNRVQAFVEMLE
jgi:benzoyl-CoA reductase/2-hydroxyglutaryl-CoA dehydratase subunit BcrC/BadD/HgdB